jgi:hypothetical protein
MQAIDADTTNRRIASWIGDAEYRSHPDKPMDLEGLSSIDVNHSRLGVAGENGDYFKLTD